MCPMCSNPGERRRPVAERHEQVRVLEHRFERVRRLGLVGEEKPAADGIDTLRGAFEIQRPDGHIDDVAPEVDEGAARIVPEMPVREMRSQRMVGPLRGRSEPEVIVERRRHGRRLGCRCLGLQSATSSRVHTRDASERAGLHQLDDAPVVGVVVVDVIAHLADALVFERRIGHHPAFGHAIAQRLLDEDVLARLERPHRRNRVPVIGRDDDDRIDLAIFEHAAEVAEGFRLVPADLLDLGDRAIEVIAIDVADGRDAGVGVL